MSDANRLVFAVIEFLESQVQVGNLSSDATESLEVAIQCLETAYGLDTSNEEIANQLKTGKPLLEIFNEATKVSEEGAAAAGGVSMQCEPTPSQDITPQQRADAEKLKVEGNNCMKAEKYKQALEYYTQAISVDCMNAVYYCNRAAAYSKIEEHQAAIEDCKKALVIDPKYSKAYGRMGLAFTSINEHEKARDAYKKAIELDPDNASYITNLKIAEQKLREINLGGGGGGIPGFGGFGGMGPGGMPDMGALLGNPALMNMASTMMQNPEMQRLMHGMLGSAMQGGGAATANTSSGETNTDPSASMATLLQAGQQLAQQVQTTNPDLVDQLRHQLSTQGGGESQQPPPAPPQDDSGKK
ncbi:small glutamine-rich tetratricopeptide repeat-containing protein beta-like [Saccoglossus kowalevskii]|uniref:Small glutamine-rich tetratricopeptide repeat-containing protein alpha-like n=1 Tax=Saccoglossus kowalevskii TaxID=10224 RepID=A0ABM0GVD9_SACKO|nr:PREDICTED: small glutamine-rich tetratricopeptide repeat-containing protein alpha-like [Saccoglossus kowalevskii]